MRRRDIIDVRPDNVRWFDECGPFTKAESEALLGAQHAIGGAVGGKTDAVVQAATRLGLSVVDIPVAKPERPHHWSRKLVPGMPQPGAQPEPPYVPATEGWALFDAGGSSQNDDGRSPFQLQRYDDPGDVLGGRHFDSDDAAWLHVITMAAGGSALEREALDWLADNSPGEIDVIAKMFPVVRDVIAQIKA